VASQSTENREKGVSLGQPAVYRIVVQGAFPAEYADRLGGLHVEASGGRHGGQATTLTGRLRDQSQLLGVLNGLYEMHLPILSIELLEIE
jgi:hypothetical protein